MLDDSATAARHVETLEPLLPRLRVLVEGAHARWPSQSLDIPSDPEGRAFYLRLTAVQQACREAAYRARLAGVGGGDPRQEVLLRAAVATAATALARAEDVLGTTPAPAGEDEGVNRP